MSQNVVVVSNYMVIDIVKENNLHHVKMVKLKLLELALIAQQLVMVIVNHIGTQLYNNHIVVMLIIVMNVLQENQINVYIVMINLNYQVIHHHVIYSVLLINIHHMKNIMLMVHQNVSIVLIVQHVIMISGINKNHVLHVQLDKNYIILQNKLVIVKKEKNVQNIWLITQCLNISELHQDVIIAQKVVKLVNLRKMLQE